MTYRALVRTGIALSLILPAGDDTAGTPVTFATSGPHTVRIQQREDGVSID